MIPSWQSRTGRMNRRGFVIRSGATVAGLAAVPASGFLSAAEGTGAGIIDTHTHFYDPTRPQGVPWPPKEDAFLHRRVMPSEFEQLARPLGVTGTVVVEERLLFGSNWPVSARFTD